MDSLLVGVFEQRGKEREAARVLRELDAAGSLDVFATSLLGTGVGGEATVLETSDQGPLGTAVCVFTERLLVALAGPPQLRPLGGGDRLVEDVVRRLRPGGSVLVAELWEQWVQPVDAQLSTLGAVVLRGRCEEAFLLPAARGRAGAALAAARAEHEAKMALIMAKFAVARGRVKAGLDARISERLAQHRHRMLILMRASWPTHPAS